MIILNSNYWNRFSDALLQWKISETTMFQHNFVFSHSPQFHLEKVDSNKIQYEYMAIQHPIILIISIGSFHLIVEYKILMSQCSLSYSFETTCLILMKFCEPLESTLNIFFWFVDIHLVSLFFYVTLKISEFLHFYDQSLFFYNHFSNLILFLPTR